MCVGGNVFLYFINEEVDFVVKCNVGDEEWNVVKIGNCKLFYGFYVDFNVVEINCVVGFE